MVAIGSCDTCAQYIKMDGHNQLHELGIQRNEVWIKLGYDDIYHSRWRVTADAETNIKHAIDTFKCIFLNENH